MVEIPMGVAIRDCSTEAIVGYCKNILSPLGQAALRQYLEWNPDYEVVGIQCTLTQAAEVWVDGNLIWDDGRADYPLWETLIDVQTR